MNPSVFRKSNDIPGTLRPVSLGEYRRARAKYRRAVDNCVAMARGKIFVGCNSRDIRAAHKWARVCHRWVAIIDAFNLNPNNRIDL